MKGARRLPVHCTDQREAARTGEGTERGSQRRSGRRAAAAHTSVNVNGFTRLHHRSKE